MRIQQSSSFLPLLVLVSLFVVSIEVSAIRFDTSKVLGGWKPIEDLNDPHVQEIGQFAIDEHNKEAKTSLKLDHLVSGESQVVAGINYKLVISASGDGDGDGDGSSVKNYEAVVWEKAGRGAGRSLTSFKQV